MANGCNHITHSISTPLRCHSAIACFIHSVSFHSVCSRLLACRSLAIHFNFKFKLNFKFDLLQQPLCLQPFACVPFACHSISFSCRKLNFMAAPRAGCVNFLFLPSFIRFIHFNHSAHEFLTETKFKKY